MGLLLGLLAYLIAAIAIVGGAAAFVFSVVEPAVTTVPVQQEVRKVAPRVQAWLDRKAEGLVYAEMEKVAALAEQKRAEARRMKIPSTAELAAFALARDEERQAAERESATRTKPTAKRDPGRRSRQPRDAEHAGPPRVAQGQSLQYFPDLHGRSQ